nr:MAG TPA: hypothetical protein [Caudoviricetes sp.]
MMTTSPMRNWPSSNRTFRCKQRSPVKPAP